MKKREIYTQEIELLKEQVPTEHIKQTCVLVYVKQLTGGNVVRILSKTRVLLVSPCEV